MIKFILRPAKKTVAFELEYSDFSYYDVDLKRYHVDRGKYKIQVGKNANDASSLRPRWKGRKTTPITSRAGSYPLPDFSASNLPKSSACLYEVGY